MTRTSIAIAVLLVSALALGCKGEKVVQPDPRTEEDLKTCQKNLSEKDKLVQALKDDNARLQLNAGSASEVAVTFEGSCDKLTVRPPKPGEVRPVDDKATAAASKEFINVVERSRGAIQKCYEQALKKNTGLQSSKVNLQVSASFAPSGAFKTASFSPSLGDAFDRCMQTVASKWALPANSPAMTFRAPVSLTPS
jgi:hypothetical protein